MKQRFFLLLLLSACCVKLYADTAISLPCKKNIEKYKNKISSDYKIGKITAYSMGVATISAFAYYAYKFFSSEEKKYDGKVLSNKQLTQKLLDMDTLYTDQFEATLFSFTWFKNIGKASFDNLLSAYIGYSTWGWIEKFYKKSICFENIDSFITFRLSDMSSLYEFLSTAQIFNYSQRSCFNFNTSKNELLISGKNLVYDIEHIIAYMFYKSIFYADKNVMLSEQELQIPIDMYEYCCTFFNACNKSIENGDFKEIPDMANSFGDDLKRYINTFDNMERRINWQLG